MNQTISRRDLFRGAAMVPVGIALASCAGGNQVPAWVAAIAAIGREAVLILPQLVAAGLPGAAASQAAAIIGSIQNVAQTISAASTAAQGQAALGQIEIYINAVAPIVADYAGLVPGGSILGLIVAALPAVELAVNVIVDLLTPQAKALAGTAPTAIPSTPTAAAAPLSAQQAMERLIALAALPT